uniref:Uncharacterized protein n=1 Tax=Arundo donax TaxID=35708 RepID=A0A0A9FHY7_ARUDO
MVERRDFVRQCLCYQYNPEENQFSKRNG